MEQIGEKNHADGRDERYHKRVNFHSRNSLAVFIGISAALLFVTRMEVTPKLLYRSASKQISHFGDPVRPISG